MLSRSGTGQWRTTQLFPWLLHLPQPVPEIVLHLNAHPPPSPNQVPTAAGELLIDQKIRVALDTTDGCLLDAERDCSTARGILCGCLQLLGFLDDLESRQ